MSTRYIAKREIKGSDDFSNRFVCGDMEMREYNQRREQMKNNNSQHSCKMQSINNSITN